MMLQLLPLIDTPQDRKFEHYAGLKYASWPLDSVQVDGTLPRSGHAAHTPQHDRHCLKPFDILTGLVDNPINSIKGSCHRQELCLQRLS